MSKQRINELGSEIRQLHNAIVESKGDTTELSTRFNKQLLELINQALESEEVIEKLFKLLEKS